MTLGVMTQHSNTHKNDTQHYNILHNDTLHNDMTLSIMTHVIATCCYSAEHTLLLRHYAECTGQCYAECCYTE